MANLSERAMADALGLSKSTVRQCKQAGMPMASVEAAEEWRQKSVNGRKAAQPAAPRAPASTPPGTPAPACVSAKPDAPVAPAAPLEETLPALSILDVGFDEVMMQREALLLDRARVALEGASVSGNAGEFNFALMSYAKLQDVFAKTRERWLETKRKRGEVLTCDEAMAVIGPHEAEVRRALAKFGDRYAAKANPANPALAKRVMDEGIDAAFDSFGAVRPALTKAFRPTGEDA